MCGSYIIHPIFNTKAIPLAEGYSPSAFLDVCSYLGGSDDEECKDVNDLSHMGTCIDSQGNIIIVGRTESTDFPLKNELYSTKKEGSDVTISKFTPDGSGLIFSTYFGGNGNDWATSVKVDSNDNILIVGTTTSTDFPVSNAMYENNLGGLDLFILKLNPTGTSIIFSTFYGGSLGDWGYDIEVDPNDCFYVTGSSFSTDFPFTHDDVPKLGVNLHLTKFSSSGNSIEFCRVFGGDLHDWGYSIEVDQDFNVVVLGSTRSANFNHVNALQETDPSEQDLFLVKLNSTGHSLLCSNLGTSASDSGYDVKLTHQNDIILLGATKGDSVRFTVEDSDIQSSGLQDLFLVKISADLQSITQCKIFGGSRLDEGLSMCLDENQNLYVCGYSYSLDDFPLLDNSDTVDSTYNSFIMKLDPSFTLNFSTFLGGNQKDSLKSIFCRNGSTIVAAGLSASTSEMPIRNAFQESNAGSRDMFFIKFDGKNLKFYATENEKKSVSGFVYILPPFLGGIGFIILKLNQKRKQNFK